MDEFGFYQEVYPVVLYIGDNPTVVTFHNDTVVEAIVIYNRPETAYPVRLWVEGKGAADGGVKRLLIRHVGPIEADHDQGPAAGGIGRRGDLIGAGAAAGDGGGGAAASKA